MSGRHRKPHNRAPGRHRRPPGPSRWLAPGLVAVALLGAGGVGAHAALSNSDHGSAQPPSDNAPSVNAPSGGAQTPSSTPSAPASATLPSVTPPATPTPQAAHRPAVALRLAVTGSVSWIDVRRPNGHVLVSGMVRHGHTLTYRHGPLLVVIGNAGAVQVTRHSSTHRAGQPGEVVRLTLP